MISNSFANSPGETISLDTMAPRDFGTYGFVRARDIAFEAVLALWRKRRSEGMKQVDLAKTLGRDTGWISRSLRGPGNWTLRTFGELVAAMDGDIEIIVRPVEDVAAERLNYDAYAELEKQPSIQKQPRLGSVMNAKLPAPIQELPRKSAIGEKEKNPWILSPLSKVA